MRIKIADIRLAPGQVGFYDELTNIHLTLTKPYGSVYQGMNTSGLQRSVNSGRLILTWGSLRPTPVAASEEAPISQPVAEKAKAAQLVKEEVKEVAVEESIQVMNLEEEVSVETEVVEETVEAVEVETIEEAPKASKKKSTKKSDK